MVKTLKTWLLWQKMMVFFNSFGFFAKLTFHTVTNVNLTVLRVPVIEIRTLLFIHNIHTILITEPTDIEHRACYFQIQFIDIFKTNS